MIKKIKRYGDLPLEVGKEYLTKMQTQETFIIDHLDYKKVVGVDVPSLVWGFYTRSPHIGLCPLSPDRLVHDKEEIGEMDTCSNCGEILSL